MQTAISSQEVSALDGRASEQAVAAHHIRRVSESIGMELQVPERAEAGPLGVLTARLPVATVQRLWEAAVRISGDPCFPLGCACVPLDQGRSIVTLACMASPDLGGAIQTMLKLWPLVTEEFGLELERDRNSMRLVATPRLSGLGSACGMEYHIAAVLHSGRLMCPEAVPRVVRLAHRPPRTAHAAMEEVFGTPVQVGHWRVEIVFDGGVGDLPLQSLKPLPVANLVRALAQDLLRGLRSTTPAVDRARAQLRLLVDAGGRRSLPLVARRCAMSPRTLARRLAEEGSSFAGLVDDVLRGRAMSLLADPALAITDVAAAVDMSRQGFHRAFRRWTGCTPSAWRKSQAPRVG